jgi:TLD
MLYSTVYTDGGLQTLMEKMVESERPTLMLVQHEELFPSLVDQTTQSRSHVFGAITNIRWCEGGVGGTHEDSLLSLYPHYRVVKARVNPRAKKNYCYVNSSQCESCSKNKPQGVGFGGIPGRFRLWLDRDLTKSYATTKCPTYEDGVVLDHHTEKLNITLIELWAIIEVDETMDEPDYKIDYNDPLRNLKYLADK